MFAVREGAMAKPLEPSGLKLLIENSVKHNQLSKTRPLLIDVFTTAGKKLIINNNLQPRIIKGPSNRIGLGNIRSKYSLLGQNGFQVLEDGKTFSVVLPLIWNKVLDKNVDLPGFSEYQTPVG